MNINNLGASTYANLEAAIEVSGISLSDIASIEVTQGYVTSEDWAFIADNRDEFITLKTLTVGGSVISAAPLPGYFLYENTSIETVSIAKAIEIGYNAFRECSALELASFPQAIQIGDAAFSGCSALQSASFPKATQISAAAFDGCSALKDVYFPAATNLGGGAFSNCQNLVEVSFPSVTDMSISAFYSCIGLKSASFPKVEMIIESAFLNCTALSSLSFPAAPPDLYNAGWFDGCPSPRFLTLVDEDGNPLEGAALDSAISAYEADTGYDQATGLWHGWTLNRVLIGDANNDGKINNRDVVTILRWLAATPFNPNEDQIARGDVDGNGRLTEEDAQALINIIAGMGNG